jgi:hypothetical protein
MSVSGLKIVSVYDPATGTVVQLNKIAPDGEFKKEALYSETTKDGLLYAGDDSSFEFLAFDDTGFDQLETWMKTLTPVRLVTYGVEDNILWYEDATITVKRSFGFKVGQRNGFTVKISKSGGEHAIYIGANIFAAYPGWKDTNLDNVVDGYSNSGSAARTPYFGDGKQRFLLTTTGSLYFSKNLIYPIAGAELSYFINKGSNDTGGYRYQITFESFANAVLSDNYFTDNIVQNIKTSVNSWKITCYFATVENLASGNCVDQYIPYLGSRRKALEVINY